MLFIARVENVPFVIISSHSIDVTADSVFSTGDGQLIKLPLYVLKRRVLIKDSLSTLLARCSGFCPAIVL